MHTHTQHDAQDVVGLNTTHAIVYSAGVGGMIALNDVVGGLRLRGSVGVVLVWCVGTANTPAVELCASAVIMIYSMGVMSLFIATPARLI